MNKVFCINASDFASISGYNCYATQTDILEKLCKSNRWFQEKYVPTIKVYETNIERVISSLTTSELETESKCFGVKSEDLINTLIEISKSTNNLETEESSKTDLYENIKQSNSIKLIESINKDSQIERGKFREDNALLTYEKKNNTIVRERNSKLYKKILIQFEFNDNTYDILVVGRIDGLTNECELIETKNRRNRLFGKIPIYEKVQLELYMWFLDKKSCIHIENYNDIQNKIIYDQNKDLFNGMVENCKKILIGLINQYSCTKNI